MNNGIVLIGEDAVNASLIFGAGQERSSGILTIPHSFVLEYWNCISAMDDVKWVCENTKMVKYAY